MTEESAAFVAALKVLRASLPSAQIAGVHTLAVFAEAGSAVEVLGAGIAQHPSGVIVVVADVSEGHDVLAGHGIAAGVVVRIALLGAKARVSLRSPDHADVGGALATGSTEVA